MNQCDRGAKNVTFPFSQQLTCSASRTNVTKTNGCFTQLVYRVLQHGAYDHSKKIFKKAHARHFFCFMGTVVVYQIGESMEIESSQNQGCLSCCCIGKLMLQCTNVL